MTAVWWILGILAVLFLVYLWLIAPAGKKPDDSALKGWLYAHRGLHDGNHQVAENSLEAFRRAMETGYGMELDVQLTADDQLVVFHDKNLKRVCGVDQGSVYSDLRAADGISAAGRFENPVVFLRYWRWWTAKRPCC